MRVLKSVFFILFFINGHLFSQEVSDSLIRVFDSIGDNYSKHFDNKNAIDFYLKSLNFKKINGDTLGVIKDYENISYSYQQLKEYKKSIEYQLRAIELKAEAEKLQSGVYYEKVKKLINADDSLNLTRLYYRYALLLDKMEKKNQSIDFFIQSLKLAHELNYDKAVATIANDLAGEYWDLGKDKLSILRYEEALQAAINIGDSNRIAAIYLNIGDNYKEQGEFEKGMSYTVKALKIKESVKNTSRLCFYYIKAAELSKASLNYPKWKEYINKAYAIMNDKDYANEMDKALVYQNLGEIAEYENDFDKAFLFYDTLLIISEKINYLNGMRISYSSKASLYKKEGKPEKALAMLNEADKYKTENPFYKIGANNSKAELYMQVGEYEKALELLKENINDSVIDNYSDNKLQTLQMLYKVNTKLGNYKDAFLWNDSLRSYENSLRNMKVRAKIAEIETKYETEKNKSLIGILRTKNDYYNQQIKFAVFLIIILLAAIVVGIYINRINKLKARYREDKLKQQLLRTQMSPHFIFNALNSIQQLILQHKNKEAGFYLSKFSSISRIILEYSAKESIPLDKELEVLESYIEIERLRSGNEFEYKIEPDENMETEFMEIPPMIIQPFVENAIKHGLKGLNDRKGFLLLKIIDKGEIIRVVIEDNGVGINSTKPDTGHKSMAMNIFEMRRQLLQKQLKRKLSIRFVDLSVENKTGTRVIIELPVL